MLTFYLFHVVLQDDKLKHLVETEGSEDWEKIAEHFDDRSEHQCLHRWEKVLNPELVKGAWTKEVCLLYWQYF